MAKQNKDHRKERTTAKKKKTALVKPPRKMTKFTISVTGDVAQYFYCALSKAELKKIRGAGIQTEEGITSLPEVLSGWDEDSWISPASVVATVDGKEIPVQLLKGGSIPKVRNLRGKTIVFLEQRTECAEYTAEVFAYSAKDIRVEIRVAYQWTLPDKSKIDINFLSVRCDKPTDLVFQLGQPGSYDGVLFMSNGKRSQLTEEEDDDSGEYLVRTG